MLTIAFVALVLCWKTNESAPKMTAFVVGGEFTSIDKYPHAAFLGVSCLKSQEVLNFICGASVVNQQITLTAAHCFEDCMKYSRVTVSVGNEHRERGFLSSGIKYKTHPQYSSTAKETRFDIALVKLKTDLRLGWKIRRVALMRNPPYSERAYISGWGIISEVKAIGTYVLKHTNQTVMTRETCQKVLGRNLPEGCFCGGTKNSPNYAAAGDSGSPLVVRGYIQIGLVSLKYPEISPSIVIYTDVGYHYDWIKESTKKLFCS